MAAYERGTLPPKQPYSKPIQDPVARFWLKVVKIENGCWEWQGAPNDAGYGRFWFNGVDDRAHRVSYILEHGSIPDGLFVLHECDNRLCVRPDHLFLGTAKDNTEDMITKERGMWQTRNIGKLTPEQRREIKALTGVISAKDVMARYSVSRDTVWMIQTGRRKV